MDAEASPPRTLHGASRDGEARYARSAHNRTARACVRHTCKRVVSQRAATQGDASTKIAAEPSSGPQQYADAEMASTGRSPGSPLDDISPGTTVPTTTDTDEFPRPVDRRAAQGLCALVLFAGRPRPASLPAALEQAGWRVDAVDTMLGGESHDLSCAEVQEAVLQAVERQQYKLVWLGTPCASFSVLRTQPLRPTLRDRLHPSGRPGLPPAWQQYVTHHNNLANFSAAIALLVGGWRHVCHRESGGPRLTAVSAFPLGVARPRAAVAAAERACARDDHPPTLGYLRPVRLG
ncbi:hypothetical protein AB1Y20_022498 [Prymnesium parvum]|uniref:Uncharacterized protein n=1 Tax=Prymnesium parvum TaxID=97485 RepID=A0AB34JHB8_PRYPA